MMFAIGYYQSLEGLHTGWLTRAHLYSRLSHLRATMGPSGRPLWPLYGFGPIWMTHSEKKGTVPIDRAVLHRCYPEDTKTTGTSGRSKRKAGDRKVKESKGVIDFFV